MHLRDAARPRTVLASLGTVLLALISAAPAEARTLIVPPIAGHERVQDVPDIFGPGAVLRVGNVHMKVTNFGLVGNPFTNLSNDPSGQWPGEPGVEYLNHIGLAVGAVDPTTLDPAQARRVSYQTNWRPATLDAEDRIYQSAEGTINGWRFVNDDGDRDAFGVQQVDEDFLDGRDNDGDGMIDEDFGALGQQMYSCVMRDDTQEAINSSPGYVPLGLECRQLAWAYSVPGVKDFDVVEYTITNRSGHMLDSVFVGWNVDMDCGPLSLANYFQDDLDLPAYPSGEFTLVLPNGDPRRQLPHAYAYPIPSDSALCPRFTYRVNGFAVSDDDGDAGQTPGVASFLLIQHTIDPLGVAAPTRVGFRAYRSFIAGTPYDQGGNPAIPLQRYELMSSTEHVDPQTGFVSATEGTTPGDYVQWCSVGPFRNVSDGGSVQATIAFAVGSGNHATALQYPADYASYQDGTLTANALFTKHPLLLTAYQAQRAYEGIHEYNLAFPATTLHGRETPLQVAQGQPYMYMEDCRDAEGAGARIVTDQGPTWFDFDCDYCTGVWSNQFQTGLFHHTWKLPAELVADVAGSAPRTARLAPMRPSPASSLARLELDLPTATPVRVVVYDLAGRRVREVTRAFEPAGRREITWDLRDDAGAPVGPGLYFYRVALGSRFETGRVVVVR